MSYKKKKKENEPTISLREQLNRMEEEERRDDPELPPEGIESSSRINNVVYDNKKYQFIITSDGTYSGQSLFYRIMGAKCFYPIAQNIRLPKEYILTVVDAFEKKGLAGVKYTLGLS